MQKTLHNRQLFEEFHPLDSLKIFSIFFVPSFLIGLCALILIVRVDTASISKTFSDEFSRDAKTIFARDDILDLTDSLVENKEIPGISDLYISFWIYEWLDRWVPIYIGSPALATPVFGLEDIQKDFDFEDGIYLWKGNKTAALKTRRTMFAAAKRRGRFFLLGVELDENYARAYIGNRRDNLARPLLIIFFVSIVIAFLCSVIFIRSIRKYKTRLIRSIDLSEDLIPSAPFTDIGEIGKLTILHARDAAEARKEKREAILQAKNEFEKERKDFALIREINEGASIAADLSSAADSALEPILRMTSARCGVIFKIDSSGKLETLGERNIPPDLAEELKYAECRLPIAKSDINPSNEITFSPIENLTGFEKTFINSLIAEGLTYCAIVHLIYRDRLWGIVHLYTAGKPRLSDRDITVLAAASVEVALVLENKRLLSELDTELKTEYKFYEISKLLISTYDLDMLIENVLWIIHETLNAQYCSVLMIEEETENLVVKGSWGYAQERTNIRIPIGKGITGWVAQNGQALVVSDVHLDTRYIEGTESISSEMAVPLIADEKVIGVLDCESETENAFDDKDLHFMNSFAGLAALAIKRTSIQTEQARQSICDPVTELYNQRYFDDYIKNNGEEILLRHGKVSIAVIDVTNIGRIIQEYGRAAGNLVLKQTGEMLKDIFPGGIVSRYTGNEFMVLLPGVGEEAMERLIENIQNRRTNWAQEHPDAIPLSFTAGYATATRYDQLKSLIESAGKRANDESNFIDREID